MSERFDIRIPFIHLSGKEALVQHLPAEEKDSNMWIPIDGEILLNAAEVLRIDKFEDKKYHIYMKNGDFYRTTTGFTTTCI